MAAKKKGPTPAPNRMKLFYVLLAVIAVVGVAAIVYATQGGGAGGIVAEPIDLEQITNAQELREKARGVALGVQGAPVDILVFSDFTCPACATWSGQIEPLVKRDFVETGKVRLTYYDYPLGGAGHKHGFVAARAARCAGDQERFWEYHDRLFGTQSQWAYSQSLPADHFVSVATDVGIDTRAFQTCLRSDQHAEVVTANRMLGDAVRVGGTPTVFVNGKQLDNWSNYEHVKKTIEAAGGV